MLVFYNSVKPPKNDVRKCILNRNFMLLLIAVDLKIDRESP